MNLNKIHIQRSATEFHIGYFHSKTKPYRSNYYAVAQPGGLGVGTPFQISQACKLRVKLVVFDVEKDRHNSQLLRTCTCIASQVLIVFASQVRVLEQPKCVMSLSLPRSQTKFSESRLQHPLRQAKFERVFRWIMTSFQNTPGEDVASRPQTRKMRKISCAQKCGWFISSVIKFIFKSERNLTLR